MLSSLQWYQRKETGFSIQQSSRPQTLGYGLADSPVGQMAWIIEKFHGWSDCADGDRQSHPENVFSRDHLLGIVMLYWLNNAATSSAHGPIPVINEYRIWRIALQVSMSQAMPSKHIWLLYGKLKMLLVSLHFRGFVLAI